MKTFGYVLLVLGLIIGGYALTMDTSVPVSYPKESSDNLPERVNNLGLMNDKSNYLIFSGILTVAGLAFIFLGKPTDSKAKVESMEVISDPRSGISNSKRYENLEKIGTLLEKGIITKDEFEIEKKRIMSDTVMNENKKEGNPQETFTEETILNCERVQMEIKKPTSQLFSGFNPKLVEALRDICTTKKEASNLLDSYERIYHCDLIADISKLSSRYSVIKDHLKPLIEIGIIDEAYPHKRIKNF